MQHTLATCEAAAAAGTQRPQQARRQLHQQPARVAQAARAGRLSHVCGAAQGALSRAGRPGQAQAVGWRLRKCFSTCVPPGTTLMVDTLSLVETVPSNCPATAVRGSKLHLVQIVNVQLWSLRRWLQSWRRRRSAACSVTTVCRCRPMIRSSMLRSQHHFRRRSQKESHHIVR